ncbi:hypothetical protein Csa_023622, partial [Cucumis sativus]
PSLPLYTTCTLQRVVAFSLLISSPMTFHLMFSRILMLSSSHVVSLMMDSCFLTSMILRFRSPLFGRRWTPSIILSLSRKEGKPLVE